MKINIKGFIANKSRRALLLLFDCYIYAIITYLYYIAVSIFKSESPIETSEVFVNAGILLAAIIVARFILGVYSSVWRYTRTLNYLKLLFADAIGTCVAIFISWIARIHIGLEIFLILAPMNALATLASRYVYRLFYKQLHKTPSSETSIINIAIVGAGQLGAFLANELLCNHQSKYRPIFFIDTDAQKVGNNVAGLKVYAENEDVFELIKKHHITELFVAVANLDNDEAMRIYKLYSHTTCKLKI